MADERSQPITVRVPEAVRMIGVSRSRLYELMRNGEVEFAKIGATTLIIVASLQALIGRRSVSRLD